MGGYNVRKNGAMKSAKIKYTGKIFARKIPNFVILFPQVIEFAGYTPESRMDLCP